MVDYALQDADEPEVQRLQQPAICCKYEFYAAKMYFALYVQL